MKYPSEKSLPLRLRRVFEASIGVMVEEGLLSSDQQQWGGAKVENAEEERYCLLALCFALGEFVKTVCQSKIERKQGQRKEVNIVDPVVDISWEIENNDSDPLFTQKAKYVVQSLSGGGTWRESCSLMKSHLPTKKEDLLHSPQSHLSSSISSIDLLNDILFCDSPDLKLLNIFSSIFQAGYWVNWDQFFLSFPFSASHQ